MIIIARRRKFAQKRRLSSKLHPLSRNGGHAIHHALSEEIVGGNVVFIRRRKRRHRPGTRQPRTNMQGKTSSLSGENRWDHSDTSSYRSQQRPECPFGGDDSKSTGEKRGRFADRRLHGGRRLRPAPICPEKDCTNMAPYGRTKNISLPGCLRRIGHAYASRSRVLRSRFPVTRTSFLGGDKRHGRTPPLPCEVS